MNQKSITRILSGLSCLTLLMQVCQPAYAAQPTPLNTSVAPRIYPNGPRNVAPPQYNAPVDLNLASTQPSMAASLLIRGGNGVNINAGGSTQFITPNMLLTPAQFVALSQVVANRPQSLNIDASGAATGGAFALTGFNRSVLSELVIPENVSATNRNNSHGLLVTGFAGIGGSLLNTVGSSPRFLLSAGTLSIASTGQLISQTPRNSIIATTGNIANAGLISVPHGSITFGAPDSVDLVFNNAGGRVEAPNGSISFRSPSTSTTALTSITGGTLAAQNINVFGGKGHVDVNLNRIDGTLNVAACTADVLTKTGTLTFGKLNVTGDPVIQNAGGDVLLTQNVKATADLAILASGSIKVAPGKRVTSIDVSDTTGHQLNLVAGFDFTNPSGQNFQISGPSTSGGDVNLPGVKLLANATAGAGGNVLAVAHEGSAARGLIKLGNVSATGTSGGSFVAYSNAPGTTGTPVFQDGTLTGGAFTSPSYADPLAFTNLLSVEIGSIDVSGTNNAGGTIDVRSLGGIKTGALSANGGTAGGAGGGILLAAPLSIVTGTVSASGGNSTTGTGGAGGGVLLQTYNSLGRAYGSIVVNGTLEAKGGAGTTGGAGGAIAANGATVQVKAAKAGISVSASGGAGGADGQVSITTMGTQAIPANFDLGQTTRTEVALPGGLFTVGNSSVNGTTGAVTVGSISATKSNASQLTAGSSFANGTLTIGVQDSTETITENGSPLIVNAVTAGKRTLISPAEAAAIYEKQRFPIPGFSIGASHRVEDPNPSGVNNELFVVIAAELPTQFKTFNLPAPSAGDQLAMRIIGYSSFIKMPTSQTATIGSRIEYFNANSVNEIDFGNRPLSLGYSQVIGGAFTSAAIWGNGNLTLKGTAPIWTMNGYISSNQIIIDHEGKPLTIRMDTAKVAGAFPTFLAVNSLTFRNPGNSITLQNGFITGDLLTDNSAGKLANLSMFNTAVFPGISGNLSANLDVSSRLDLELAGNVRFAGTSVLNSPGKLTLGGSTITLDPGAQIHMGASGGIIDARQTVTIGNGVSMDAIGNLVIKSDFNNIVDNGGHYTVGGLLHMMGATGITMDGANIFADKGVAITPNEITVMLPTKHSEFTPNAPVNITNSTIYSRTLAVDIASSTIVTIGTGNNISAGSLAPGAPLTGVLNFDQVKDHGSIIVVGFQKVNINSDLRAIGGDIAVVGGVPFYLTQTSPANITLAPGLTFTADGGSIFMTSTSGAISGSNETFNARALGVPDIFRGGSIEIGAGLRLTEAFTRSYFINRPNSFMSPALTGGIVTNTALMGSNVSINNNGINLGAVEAFNISKPTSPTPGTVDVSNSQISVTRGSVFFDAFDSPNSVTMTGSRFNAESVDKGSGAFIPVVSNVKFDTLGLASLVGFVNARFTFINSGLSVQQKLNALSDIGFTGEQIAEFRETQSLLGINILPTDQVHVGMKIAGVTDQSNTNTNIINGNDTHTIDIANAGPDGGSSGDNGGAAGNDDEGHAVTTVMNGNTAIIHVNQMRSDLLFFTQASQMLQGNLGGSADATIIGSAGTALSNTKELVILHTGHVLADTGRDPLIISTSMGEVTIGPNSTVVIDNMPGKPLKVRALACAGNNDDPIAFRDAHNSQNSVPLKPGDALILGEEELSDPDLIPAEGTDAIVSAGISVRSQAKKYHFSVEKFAHREMMPMDKIVRLSTARSRALQRMNAHVTKGKTPTAIASKGQSKPVSYSDQDPHSPVHILASQGSEFFNSEAGKVKLLIGSTFIECDEPTQIITDAGTVNAAANSRFGVEAEPGLMRVKSCSMPGLVEVVAAGQYIDLGGGRELTVAHRELTTNDTMPADGVGRRAMRVYGDGKHHIAVSEFSIASLLMSTKYLRPLLQKVNGRNNEQLEALIKLAAATETLGAGHGRYQAQQRQSNDISDNQP